MFQINQNQRRAAKTSTQGFTLIELLIVIAILAVLATILFPVFSKVRENARRSTCASNLKQIGLALQMYIDDFDDTSPNAFHNNGASTVSWRQIIQPYAKSVEIETCPSNPEHLRVANAAIAGYPAVYASYAAACSEIETDTDNKALYVGMLRCSAVDRPLKIPVIANPSQLITIVESTNIRRIFDPAYAGLNYRSDTDNVTDPSNAVGHLFAGHMGSSNFLFADGHVKAMKPMLTIPPSKTDTSRINLWKRDNSNWTGTSNYNQHNASMVFAENKYK